MRKTKKPTSRLFFIFKDILQKIFGKTLRQQIGTSLMVAAIVGLFYIFFPLIQLFIPVSPAQISSSSKIEIPKIGIVAPINWEVDPFDEEVYREALTDGIAHAAGTARPNASGTTFMFAHSSDFPWRITRYNVIFFRLNELKASDKIIVTQEGERFEYKVREKKVVWPSEIEYLTESSRTQLILQTCWPIGTAFQRLLIFADPV